MLIGRNSIFTQYFLDLPLNVNLACFSTKAKIVVCLVQDAMVKDTLERAIEPTLNLKAYLKDAYVHPVFKGVELDRPMALDDEENNPLVPTKRSRKSSKSHSEEGV